LASAAANSSVIVILLPVAKQLEEKHIKPNERIKPKTYLTRGEVLSQVLLA